MARLPPSRASADNHRQTRRLTLLTEQGPRQPLLVFQQLQEGLLSLRLALKELAMKLSRLFRQLLQRDQALPRILKRRPQSPPAAHSAAPVQSR